MPHGNKPRRDDASDFILKHSDNFFTLQPVSLPAQRYADQFLPRNPSLWVRGEFIITASEFVDVLKGIQMANLAVGGAA
jgi:hypothetical protein